MTCVVGPSLHAFSTDYEWPSMSSSEAMQMESVAARQQAGYVSSESESRRGPTSSGKKRASRAGTRSVSTLSTAQLERKRANDREAQRAIRQRTKDHITGLEKNITDLRMARDASDKLATATQQRNRELEEENSYLRNRLSELGYPVTISRHDSQRVQEPSLVGMHATSPTTPVSSIPRGSPTSTPANISMANSQASSSRHNSWQHPPASFASAPTTITRASPISIGHGLTTWRSHDSVQNVHPAPAQLQDPGPSQPAPSYTNASPADRAQWVATAQGYPYPDQKFDNPHQPQTQYPQPGFAGETSAQQTPYQAQQAPPQAEFQSLTVSNSPGYQMPPAPSFPPPTQYPMASMPAPTGSDYAPQPGQMHPPPPPTPTYHHPQGGPAYNAPQPQAQPPLQFRDDTGNRAYALAHFPSG